MTIMSIMLMMLLLLLYLVYEKNNKPRMHYGVKRFKKRVKFQRTSRWGKKC